MAWSPNKAFNKALFPGKDRIGGYLLDCHDTVDGSEIPDNHLGRIKPCILNSGN